ncbi:MAG: HAD family hydrolase [Lachnospiraceae bacterium]
MDKKLLFFDIDGTLTDERTNTIPDSTKRALKMAKENGHYIFINTGRTLSTIGEDIKQLDFDGLLCGCGTYILFQNKILFQYKVPKEIQEMVLSLFEQYKLQGALEGVKDCFFPNTPDDCTHPKIIQYRNNYIEKSGYVKYFDAENIEFVKFIIFTGEEFPKTEEYKKIMEELEKHFEIIDRENDLLEIIPRHLSKATCIDFICEYLGVSLDDCYVFGDSTNDTAMLTHVPHSIAMGNGMEEVLDLVSYVTTPSYEDGIYLAMKHFGLI